MKYLLGVDLGTSGTKTVLFDEKGTSIASKTYEYPLLQPKNGWAEQDPKEWYKAAITTIKAVITQSGVASEDIVGLSISGQMHGLVMLDEHDEVLTNAILWCDARTGAQCEEITNKVGKKRLIEICANPALPGFTAPKILWVRENLPNVYKRCRTILLPKDYVRFMLTGVKGSEISDASGTNLLDIKKRVFSEEILNALDIDKNLLPPVIESSDIAGYITKEVAELTGLKEGTIVAGGAGDNAAAALGTGVCEDGQAFVTLGTSGVVFAHTSNVSIDPLGRVHTFCSAVKNEWTAMSCTLAAGLSLRWARDVFFDNEKVVEEKEGRDIYNLMTKRAEAIESGSDGLIYLPYLMGERSPVLDPEARGVFFGLSARHTKDHLTRAVLEGITLSQRHNLEVLKQMNICPNILTACGGGGKSPMWRQMIADVLDKDVNTIKSTEGPALGAAILAAVAAGLYKSVKDACKALVQKDEKITIPREKEVARYNEIFSLYEFLYPTMRPAFAKLAALRQNLEEGKNIKYKSVFSVDFERYGKVVEGFDVDSVVEVLKTLPTPKDAVTYEPSEKKLESLPAFKDIKYTVFGGLDMELGYCSGHNRALNCLEYHRNSELNITSSETIFMLAPITAIKDGVVDSSAVEIFVAPAKCAVLFYETSLHYAPCNADNEETFCVAVGLPRNTNTQRPAESQKTGEASMLTHNNKWLLAHKDSPEYKANITSGLVVGENITLR